jgi:16S rRNA (adenine1518-N6/adenine1519-N6)-dimethyltransferase
VILNQLTQLTQLTQLNQLTQLTQLINYHKQKEMYIRPKKALGQHFLKDKNIASKIVSGLSGAVNVLEIGPGKGVLTQFLINIPGIQLIVVEIDKESVDYLNHHYTGLNILSGDFLKIDITSVFSSNFSIIGNFPYNISSQIFFKVLENKNLVDEVVCMIQKEVAERIVSPPGNKSYGILSVFLQAYYHIEILFTVNPGVFEPPPKVKSAVIKLKRNNVKQLNCNEGLFFEIVKKSFNQRRKILRNSLKALLNLDADDPVFMKRPEQLSVNEFVVLTNLIEQKISKDAI